MIERLFAAGQIRQDCEFWPSGPISSLPRRCSMPEDLKWFYTQASGGNLCFTKLDDDIPAFWAWTTVSSNDLRPIGESVNSYQVSLDYLSKTLARFAFLIVTSASREVDLAIFLGGPHHGKCFRVEYHSLVPGVRIEVEADSFSVLFKNLLACDDGQTHARLSLGQYIALSQCD